MAKVTVRRIEVFSMAKMYGALMAIMGLIFGGLYGVVFILIGAIGGSTGFGGSHSNQALAGGSMIGIGIGAMIFMPIFYGILGFVFGALGAFIYNVLAGFVGGVQLDLESHAE